MLQGSSAAQCQYCHMPRGVCENTEVQQQALQGPSMLQVDLEIWHLLLRGLCWPAQESEASCRMLRELCLRSGVLVPPELMQSSSLAGSISLQVLVPGIGFCCLSIHGIITGRRL